MSDIKLYYGLKSHDFQTENNIFIICVNPGLWKEKGIFNYFYILFPHLLHSTIEH